MKSAIVHQYYKKELENATVMLQVDPVRYLGLQLLIYKDGKMEKTKRELDENIFAELEKEGYVAAGPLEFNIYLQGLNKT